MNKTALTIIIVIILVVALFFLWYSTAARTDTSDSLPDGIILFYGDGCLHCKNVDDFITKNQIEEKIGFNKLEVWYNQDNQVILVQAAQRCQINSDEIGVPFLYDGEGKCYVGNVDVIDFLKNQTDNNE